MKHSLVHTIPALFSLLLLGCGPKSGDLTTVAETLIVGPEFSANKGLFVPDESRRSLGIKIVDIGERTVAASMELSFRIYEANGMVRVSGVATPEQAGTLKVGQTIVLRPRGGESATGRITAINSHMQKATSTIEVLGEVPGAPSAFAVGMFVNGSVTLEAGQNVVSVPRSALLQATDGDYVYTVSGKHFVRTAVKLGAINVDYAEIKEGLYAGDQIVSEPVMSLWLTELAAIKGGHACCVMPAKGK